MTQEAGSTRSKPPPVDRMSQIWRRINEHKLVQWSVAYIAIAYALQHGVVLTAEAFEWPEAVLRISMLLLILGLPVIITLAWYHGHLASRHFSTAELTIISLLLVVGSLLFYGLVKPHEDVAAGPTQSGVDASKAAAVSPAGTISVAVLPFANVSGDPSREFFSDGMTDEVSGALAKIRDLRVIARTSAFQFKGQSQDARAVGQALGASHLIEGSVRQADNRVRITAQLVRADDGVQLWSENYDRELTDIFAIQEDIARAIAGALRVPLGLTQGDTLVANRTTDVDSYQQYLRARGLARARGLGPITEAVSLLEQVVARDPGYAPGWAWLAFAEWVRPGYLPFASRGSIEEQRRTGQLAQAKAEKAAREAIRLDPKQSVAYATLASIESINGRRASGEDLYRQALALDPDDPETLYEFGLHLLVAGRLNESLQLLERLRTLDVFVPVYNATIARSKLYTGDTQAAIDILESAPLDEGGLLNGRSALAQAYAALGRFDEAANTLLQANISNSAVSRRDVEEAARLLRSAPAIVAAPETLPVLEGQLSFVYAHVGARERMFDTPERLLQISRFNPAVIWSSEFQPLRKTERFKAYVRNAGLVDYWRERGWPDLCKPVGADDFVCN